jgi:hypothetical protein
MPKIKGSKGAAAKRRETNKKGNNDPVPVRSAQIIREEREDATYVDQPEALSDEEVEGSPEVTKVHKIFSSPQLL